MSYAIGNVVYGIPMLSNDNELQPLDIQMALDTEQPGFISLYTGGGPYADAFGIELGEFDEGDGVTEISEIALTPTIQQAEKFMKLWDELGSSLRDTITKKYGSEPRVFVLWSSS